MAQFGLSTRFAFDRVKIQIRLSLRAKISRPNLGPKSRLERTREQQGSNCSLPRALSSSSSCFFSSICTHTRTHARTYTQRPILGIVLACAVYMRACGDRVRQRPFSSLVLCRRRRCQEASFSSLSSLLSVGTGSHNHTAGSVHHRRAGMWPQEWLSIYLRGRRARTGRGLCYVHVLPTDEQRERSHENGFRI